MPQFAHLNFVMDGVRFKNQRPGAPFTEGPDGYWLEILPARR